MKRILLSIVCAAMCLSALSQEKIRYVGGDISLLPQYEKYNYGYKDAYDHKINDFIRWAISDCGWNTFRVRLFVEPDTSTDPSIGQDLAYVTALGKRIKEAGAYFMLDFHYSDTWVDASHIQAPKAWQGSSDAEMAQHVADYTRDVLRTLKEESAAPDLVQVGNEIMYGLCGIRIHPYDSEGDNWEGYLGLLKAGCEAVRDELPDAKIIIHTDRPSNRSYNFYYYNKLVKEGVDFDIIGLSYYPFWHGYLTPEQVAQKTDKNNLVAALKTLKAQFNDKEVQIVECAYNFQYWPTEGVNTDTRDIWPCSKAGQYNFVKDLVDALEPLENVTGICYWFPEEAGNGDKGTVIKDWLNRGFWNENKSSGSAHAINKIGTPSADQDPAEICAPYYLGKFLGERPEGIEPVENGVQAQKRIENGILIIRRGEKNYNALGEIVTSE